MGGDPCSAVCLWHDEPWGGKMAAAGRDDPEGVTERNGVAFRARCLLRRADAGVLATQAEGQPHAALVTHATLPDASVVLWLSRLSVHARHLADEPRCALLVQSPAADGNPQTAPRLTLHAMAGRVESAAWHARFLARHPYAAPYGRFTDFALWHLTPTGAHLVEGFGRAARLPAAALAPPPDALRMADTRQHDLLAACAAAAPEALSALTARAGTSPKGEVIAVDPDGLDVSDGNRVGRVDFSAPAPDGPGLLAAINALLAWPPQG